MTRFREYIECFADVDCSLGFDLALFAVGKCKIIKRVVLHLIGCSHNSPFELRNYEDFSNYIKTIVDSV
jgi:hypothetical protein